MTRRGFLFAPFMLGSGVAHAQRSDGFIVSGVLQEAGDLGYYALTGASVALMLDPDRVPSMTRAADALVGKQVEFVLRTRSPIKG